MFLGKFAQRPNMTKLEIISDPRVHFDYLSWNSINVLDAQLVKPGSHMPAVYLRLERWACFVADIPANLSSSQLSQPTADVTEVNWRKLASNVRIIMLWAPSPARRRHICEPGLSDEVIELHYEHGETLLSQTRKPTSSWQRLRLLMRDWNCMMYCIYCKSACCITIRTLGDIDPPTGHYLGELTNKLESDDYITMFVSGGPKITVTKQLWARLRRKYEVKL